MTDRLLILGAGGHGKVVADAAVLQGQWAEIAFLDDASVAREVNGLPVLGGTHAAPELRARFSHAVVAIGDAARRLELFRQTEALGFAPAIVCHPAAVVSRHVELGAGSVLFANCVVNAGSRLGRCCIINTAATVDHDCVLGDGVHAAPGAHIAGDVRIGENSWIGIGACVREGIEIGSDVIVGAGAAVVADIADRSVVGGVPARDLAPDHGD